MTMVTPLGFTSVGEFLHSMQEVHSITRTIKEASTSEPHWDVVLLNTPAHISGNIFSAALLSGNTPPSVIQGAGAMQLAIHQQLW